MVYDGLGRATKQSAHASGGGEFAVSELLFDDGLNVVTKTYQYADPDTQTAFNATTDPSSARLYDASGRVTATLDANGNQTDYAYDGRSRQITVTDALDNRQVMVYDDADRVLTRTRVDEAGATDIEYATAYEYDNLNRVTRTIDQGADGDLTATTDNLQSTVWFDVLGRITQTEDPGSMKVATSYDKLGQATKVLEDSGAGGLGRRTDSLYDRAGRLTRLTAYSDSSGASGLQHTDYAYDQADRLTRTTYPDDTGGDRGYVVHTYDTPGRLTRFNHADNSNTDVVHDDMGRALTVTKGTEIDSYAYHASGALTSAQRGTSGNADAVSKVDRLYDGLWRLTRESQSIREGGARHVDYDYDLAGNRLTLGYPGGTTIAMSYDALNRGDVVKRGTSQIADYGYVGYHPTDLTLETGTHDVSLSMEYDGANGGRLTRMTYSQTGNTELPDYSYAFDSGGNLTQKTYEQRTSDPTEDYLHDGLDRLTKTTFGQRSGTPYEGFVYDDLGNHLTQDRDGTLTAGLFNAVNEQTKRGAPGSETAVLYDTRGNLTKDDSGQTYFYDTDNKLTRVEDGSNNRIASYTYDALGRRIEKDVEDPGGDIVTRFWWSPTADPSLYQLLEETDDGGTPNVQLYHVWGVRYVDELLLTHDSTGPNDDDHFVCRDRQFNVVALLDDSGTVVERYEYSPYGERLVLDTDYSADLDGISDVGNPIGHQGLYHDAETGLVYNRARYRDAELGRWLGRDILQYADGLNQYTDKQNRPIFWFHSNGNEVQFNPSDPPNGGGGVPGDSFGDLSWNEPKPKSKGPSAKPPIPSGIGPSQGALIGSGVEAIVTKPYDDYVAAGEEIGTALVSKLTCNTLNILDEAGELSGKRGLFEAAGKDYQWSVSKSGGKCYFNVYYTDRGHSLTSWLSGEGYFYTETKWVFRTSTGPRCPSTLRRCPKC